MSSLSTPERHFASYVFDLDQTVCLGESLLPAAAEILTALRRHGSRTILPSNNPTHMRSDFADKLARAGVPTLVKNILTSSLVLGDFLQRRMPGARLFVIGEEPVCDELRRAGFE